MSPKAQTPEEECLVPAIPGKCNYRISPERRCKHEAGWRTPHLGEGNCAQHAGHGRPLIHGKYSKFNLAQPLKEAYLDFLQDPEYKSLKDEIAKTRSYLMYLEEMEPSVENRAEFVRNCISVIDQISKLAQAAHKIEEGETYNVNVQQMSYIINALVRDIDEVCEGCPRRADLAERFANIEVVTAKGYIDGEVEE